MAENQSEKTNIKQSEENIKVTLTNMIGKDFAIDGGLLMSQLRPKEILITGGIIPAAINGTNDYGDLDIVCCNAKSFKYFTNFISSLLHVDPNLMTGQNMMYFGVDNIHTLTNYNKLSEGEKLPGDITYNISEKKQGITIYGHNYCQLLKTENENLVHRLRGLALIDCVTNYIINNKCLQIIVLKEGENNVMNYIKEFDLDICRNYFDGEKLYCENIEAIKTKKMSLYRYKYNNGKIADSLLDERSIERLEKYKKRGYKLIREIYDYIE